MQDGRLVTKLHATLQFYLTNFMNGNLDQKKLQQ